MACATASAEEEELEDAASKLRQKSEAERMGVQEARTLWPLLLLLLQHPLPFGGMALSLQKDVEPTA
jgi:hypothetical protein